MVKYLLIIESPLQLINAYEAIFTFKIKIGVLLVRYSGFSQNDKQINDTLHKLDFPDSISIQSVLINVSNRKPWDYFKALSLKVQFSSIFKSFDKIYIGNYDSPFIRLIIGKKTNLVLLDDGSRTLTAQEKFSDHFHFDWFTFFELTPYNGQSIFKNTFSHLQKKMISPESNKVDAIIFIGSNLSEDKIISEKYNLELIQKIANRYHTQQLIYIPHRSESEAKINTISSMNNVEIKRLDFPIELLPIYNQPIPVEIISFYSTALFTLSKIYGVPSTAFKFNYQESQYQEHIDGIYQYFKDYMTIVEEFDI